MPFTNGPWYTPPEVVPGSDGTVANQSVTFPKLAPDVSAAVNGAVKIGGAIGGNPLSPTALGLENQAQLDARIAAQAAPLLAGAVKQTDVGVALGVPPLDVNAKVPQAFLPTSYTGGDVDGGSPASPGSGFVDGGAP